MKLHNQFAGLLAGLMLLYVPSAFAQHEDTATASEPELTTDADDDIAAGQEVEINEDNYRQFMELKDPLQQRNAIPETAYKSQAQMQKLDKLPEESQKHLRNQLREIIVQGDPWKPGDEDTQYPFTPSEAAEKNPSLNKLETEAWGELVDSYHQREAQIYGNASRSAAAAAPGSPGGGSSGNNDGSAGKDAAQGGAGQQANQENSSRENGAAGSYSPNSSNDQAVKSTDGVSQNAMEFLKSHSGAGSSPETAGQTSQTPPASNQPGVSDEEAQNALDFLSKNSSTTSNSESAQSNPEAPERDEKIEVSQEDAQNALDYLSGGTAAAKDASTDADTISIEDLLNAQGVSGTNGNNNKEELAKPVDKDGGN